MEGKGFSDPRSNKYFCDCVAFPLDVISYFSISLVNLKLNYWHNSVNN